MCVAVLPLIEPRRVHRDPRRYIYTIPVWPANKIKSCCKRKWKDFLSKKKKKKKLQKHSSLLVNQSRMHVFSCNVWFDTTLWLSLFLMTPSRNYLSGHSISKVTQPWMHYPCPDLWHINLDSAAETECYLLTGSHLKVMPLLWLAVNNSCEVGREKRAVAGATSQPIHRQSVRIALSSL